MVEHYSKQIEVVAVPDKEPATIKRVILDRVISQYGCCAEVISDNGGEYKKEFCELLAQLFIDHRNASANHPQANGLAERTVQTMKRAIRKWTDTHAVDCHWDDALPYILLGYRCSVQAATGLCPYEILHGCKPIVPPAIMERMSEPINFDDADKAAAQLIERRQLLEEHCIIAGHNLAIAQHRDTLRFAQVRTGAYAPKSFNITPGSFVYLRRVQPNTAHMAARPEIYRVVELRANGVLLLDGRCTTTFTVHLNNVAPCHLPDIDLQQDPRLARPHANYPCSVCKSNEKGAEMMLCDGCNKAFHLHCLHPPLKEIPEEDIWLCSTCIKGGVTPATIRGLPDPQNRIQKTEVYTSRDPKSAKHATSYTGR